MDSKTCSVDGCSRLDIAARGLCKKHYQRFRHHGTTDPLESHDGLRTKYPDEYRSWYAMIRRCTKPTQESYKEYAGKGVLICNEWVGGYGFRTFLKDMGEKPMHGDTAGGMPLYTLDRIDSAKGYYKENCRWANWLQQSGNRRVSHGVRGVKFHKQSGLWYASYTIKGKRKTKYFKTRAEAIAQRKQWEEKYPY